MTIGLNRDGADESDRCKLARGASQQELPLTEWYRTRSFRIRRSCNQRISASKAGATSGRRPDSATADLWRARVDSIRTSSGVVLALKMLRLGATALLRAEAALDGQSRWYRIIDTVIPATACLVPVKTARPRAGQSATDCHRGCDPRCRRRGVRARCSCREREGQVDVVRRSSRVFGNIRRSCGQSDRTRGRSYTAWFIP
ncbi:hypothetical protein C2E23DRAFT_85102 [Lenzites betulinus]|nr:hypothetical protein C2E23DRAFT_85102 [Lenzites betulinus]